MEQALQSLLERADPRAPGAMLAVTAPFSAVNFRGAAGVADRSSNGALDPGHSFRIASMSKTFTGLLCAQLFERGELDLRQPVFELLPQAIGERLLLSCPEAGPAMTVLHLLQHRAGFSDFATSAAWFNEIAKNPAKYRSPEEIALWALENGELLFAPGTGYHYSDTGYVLLGHILQSATGHSYAKLCRTELFDPLGMDNTYLEGHEAAVGELSHCYATVAGEQIDALQINGSCDWAGGGHVSTLNDIDSFLRGLFQSERLLQAETLDTMLLGQEAKPGFYYGMGIGRKQIAGKTLWGHLGHWGSFMYYCPEQRLSLCGTLNHDGAEHNTFIARIINTLFD